MPLSNGLSWISRQKLPLRGYLRGVLVRWEFYVMKLAKIHCSLLNFRAISLRLKFWGKNHIFGQIKATFHLIIAITVAFFIIAILNFWFWDFELGPLFLASRRWGGTYFWQNFFYKKPAKPIFLRVSDKNKTKKFFRKNFLGGQFFLAVSKIKISGPPCP